jgi:hypothetical protein
MTLAHADLARAGEHGVIRETRAQDRELPRSLTIRHIDPDRGYEVGAQRWQRSCRSAQFPASGAIAAKNRRR